MANGGRRPGAGRPKGAKSLKTRSKEERAFTAIAQVAATGVPATGILMPMTAPKVAPEGISPKDLMLTTMRMAWESAHAKSREAQQVEEMAQAATDSETIESLRKTANDLRAECGRHVAIAQAAAVAVAPYLHPKLANTDSKVSMGVIVQIKNYTL